MLKEFYALRQTKDSYRRLFSDEYFDLYIWYKSRDNSDIVGFQLVYNSSANQKALIWQENIGFYHLKVDEGDNGINKTPILVLDGVFEYDDVYTCFKKSIDSLEDNIKTFILESIEKYIMEISIDLLK